MLAAMIDGYAMWLLLVGLAVGAAGAAVVLVRLPREEDDLGEMERRTEAAWIADTIERHGGIAPTSLVEEVLDLHRAYLVSPRAPVPVGASAPPLPPAAGPPPGAPVPGYGPGPGGALRAAAGRRTAAAGHAPDHRRRTTRHQRATHHRRSTTRRRHDRARPRRTG